ncbi:sugar ABC transporter permease [Nocardioides mesophilus]|uniref:sugar ABC transporter permease n=1 Tax=Nocardioides mesophilus TaxID=433659 RepID=UPI0031B583ED
MTVQPAVTSQPGGSETPAADGAQPRAVRGSWVRALFMRRPSGINLAPVILGLVVVCVGFQTANSNFLTPWNITNLSLQVASVGVIAVGVVVILLLGEIDLSVAAISGFCGAVLGVLNVQLGWNAWLSVAVAVLVGIAIGIFQGSVVTYFRVPAFVITLAGLIGLQGWTLALFGDRTAINFDYAGDVAKLTSTFLSPVAGWGIAAAIILAVAYFNLKERARLKAAGLEHSELRTQILKIVGIALVLCGAIVVFNRDRGLPLAVFIFLAIVVAMDYVIRQTRYGSRLLAIGGNAEAARRAGIPVQRIRIAAFAIGSGLAAFGGVLAASRLIAATTQSGAGDTLINAIAAAVIGGTSLFGGRGSVYSALVGVLIIGSISNGMDLLALPSAAKFIITSMVLLLAVVVDAIAARSSRSQVRE